MARFMVNYTFRGRASELMEAASMEEAEARVEAKVDKDDFEIDADEIDDVDFDIAEMHPVTRDGKEIWTTYVRTGISAGISPSWHPLPCSQLGVGRNGPATQT